MDADNNYPNEPLGIWLPRDLDAFLLWAVNNDASDISLIGGKPIFIRVHGRWQVVTRRDLSSDEIFMLLDEITRSPSTSARVKGGQDVDPSYEIKDENKFRHRFRVNATAIKDGWSTGINIVMRTIPAIPPTMDDINVEQVLRDQFFPSNGLVLVTGVMGTGKSTLLATVMREIIEQGGRSLITYESPIEFDLQAIPNARGPVCQSELPMHLSSFKESARNAARRAADVILVGESRDRETLRSMLEVSEIGVAAYSTVHTLSVHDTPSRILNVFESGEQPGIAATMFSSLRLIVQQRLLPKVGGGRVAIKEYLVFTEEDRRILMGTPIDDITPTIKEMCLSRGTDLLTAAKKLLNDNLISEESYLIIEKERS